MKIREITSEDIPAIVALLAEGFPRKSRTYWENALRVLSVRPQVAELPHLGLTLEHDDALQGVMLMIAQDSVAGPLCNLSSWYMRPDMRKYAALLFQRSLRWKGVRYTDCSPADHVLSIVRKFGFVPYTGGSVLLDARAALRSGPATSVLAADKALHNLPPDIRAQVVRGLSAGCQGFLVEGTPVLYRTTRLKRLIPAARFVLGDPEFVLRNAAGMARALLPRAIPVMLIDWPQGDAPPAGKLLPHYAVRYCRGEPAPGVGDLSDTEIGLFGL